jgi:hypothetical protein
MIEENILNPMYKGPPLSLSSASHETADPKDVTLNFDEQQNDGNTRQKPSVNPNEFSKFMFDNIIQGIKNAHDSIQSNASTANNPGQLYDKQVQSKPSVDANEFSKFMFDNIIQGMKNAHDSTTNKPNELGQQLNNQVQSKPSVNPNEFSKFMFDNILTGMNQANTAKVEKNEEVATSEKTIETESEGLSKLLVDSIMKGMNPMPEVTTPSQPTDGKNLSIFQLLNGGEQISFKYGIGIIDSKIEDKFKPSDLRHYFSYRLPSNNKPGGYENPYIYRVIISSPSIRDIKNINNLFAGKLKSSKLLKKELSDKYADILTEENNSQNTTDETVVQGTVVEPDT